MVAADRAFQDLDCNLFPPRHVYTGNVVILYALMRYVTSLYQIMSEYVDNFAVVDKKNAPRQSLDREPLGEHRHDYRKCLSDCHVRTGTRRRLQ